MRDRIHRGAIAGRQDERIERGAAAGAEVDYAAFKPLKAGVDATFEACRPRP